MGSDCETAFQWFVFLEKYFLIAPILWQSSAILLNVSYVLACGLPTMISLLKIALSACLIWNCILEIRKKCIQSRFEVYCY